MPLYIKYRPQSLDDFIGNYPTVQSLKSMFDRAWEELPRAMLFYGPTGTGKTTLCRIVAGSVGCSSCDLQEINMADFRGIETARSLIRQAGLRPLFGKSKVYILDEIQSTTKDAQQALLKLLEDSPQHVFFMLATTDPDRLLPTIRSRCTQFPVSPLSERSMVKLLHKIVHSEQKQVPDQVLEAIAQESVGHPRAALVLLDKVIDLSPERMLKAVEQASSEQGKVIDLCRQLIKGEKWDKVRETLKGLEDQDAESVRRVVMEYCSSVLLGGDNPRAYVIMDCFRRNFYDTGRAGLVIACYEVLSD